MARKGGGKEAKLSYSGHALMENRNGLVTDVEVLPAHGTAERDAALVMMEAISGDQRVTVGADKGYDSREFVAEARHLKVTPHVAQNDKRRKSAIDRRTTRHGGYAVSQQKRKRVEEIFGWLKTVGGMRKLQHRGLELVGWMLTLAAAAYNLVRIRRNLATALSLPASILATPAQSDRTEHPVQQMKVTRIEALLLERPLTDRFWMSIFPIGGMKPVARRLILKVYTDAGVVGHGEGTGGGAGLFRQGLADLVVGEDPFMVGKVWEKLFAITYSRELATRGWSRTDLIAAMAAIDAALYDVMSKSAGQPLYKFLGGYRESVPAYVAGGYYREGQGIPTR